MMFERLFKPIIDDAYNKGYTAGVLAERLAKDTEREKREYDLLRRGAELGREELLKEMETDIEEISAEEFDELASEIKPFGFVGTIDDISLVLEESEAV